MHLFTLRQRITTADLSCPFQLTGNTGVTRYSLWVTGYSSPLPARSQPCLERRRAQLEVLPRQRDLMSFMIGVNGLTFMASDVL